MEDYSGYLFAAVVVVAWVYAGYRVVRSSERRFATFRYVSPMLALGIALTVYALWPKVPEEGATESADTVILAFVLPSTLVLLIAALAIDRIRHRDDIDA